METGEVDEQWRRKRDRDRQDAAAYRKRIAAGRRIWKPELDVVRTEQLLIGLGYLPEGGEISNRDADTALARLVDMLAAVSADDAGLGNLILEVSRSPDEDT
jgi:hypothetical protein